MRVNLPNDQFIEIMDVDDVPHRVQVRVEKLYPDADMAEKNTIPLLRRMRDTFMAEIVTGWSFGELPAGKPEALGELPRGAYRELMKATIPHYVDAGFMDDPAAGKEKQPEDSATETDSSSD